MARPAVPDTSLLILRAPDIRRELSSGRAWLSMVAITEFYAGTRSRDDARIVYRIVAAARQTDHLLVPTVEEWLLTGRLIARRVRLAGSLRPRDHLADVLILVSAARVGGTVLTTNVRHFQAWAELATPPASM